MKNFFLLLIFVIISTGVMLSGIAMKNSAQSGAIMIVLCLGTFLHLRSGRNKRRSRY